MRLKLTLLYILILTLLLTACSGDKDKKSTEAEEQNAELCDVCGKRNDHSTDNHPLCAFCGNWTHLTEDHPEDDTDVTIPQPGTGCGICASDKHTTDTHPACAYCGALHRPGEDCSANTNGCKNGNCPMNDGECQMQNGECRMDNGGVCSNTECPNTDPAGCKAPAKQISCGYCGQYGHDIATCPHLGGNAQ